MALLWMDGFDHYGGSTSNMLNGVWAEVLGVSLTTGNPRTGTHSIQLPTSSGIRLRRVLGGPKTTVGVGFAFYMSNLPTSNDEYRALEFRDNANATQISIKIDSTGILGVFRGLTTVIHKTAAPVIAAESYQHFEARVTFDNTVGAVEIRINGVTVVSLVDIDTTNTTNQECSQLDFFNRTQPDVGTTYLDDVFVWDDTGTTNNDFLGDRRVRTIYPDADTATAEWSITGAVNGFDAINQTGPDGDTTYIEADTSVPVTSEFGLQDLPASTGAIAAIQTYVMQRKTEAGDGSTQTSLISGASVADGADRPITEVYTYWMDVFETDPDTGSAWTKAGVDAAKLRLRRTL